MIKKKVAIIGSGNIGTDLMIKVLKTSRHLEMAAMVGIDPNSDGLARAKNLGVATTAEGLDGLRQFKFYDDIAVIFDATSAVVHLAHNTVLRADGKMVIDLTPAAIGPYVVPPVNLEEHIGSANINMVTCGGQATIPIVHAVRQVVKRDDLRGNCRLHFVQIGRPRYKGKYRRIHPNHCPGRSNLLAGRNSARQLSFSILLNHP